MKNGLKKSAIVLAAVCASLCVSLCPKSAQAVAEAKNTLDVYVILGSDEAVGNASYQKLSTGNKKKSFLEGIENVYYYGSSDGNKVFDECYEVKCGLGLNTDEFGAELGLADYLSQNTTGEALIFKCAERNTDLGEGWESPSFLNEADGERLWSDSYENFVDLFSKMVGMYEDKGYTLRLQGTAWLGKKEKDGDMTAFLDDVRKVYAGEGIANAALAPFVIGNAEGLSGIFQKRGFVYPLTEGTLPTGDDANKVLQLGREIGKTICEEAKEPNLLVYATGKGKCDVENQTFANDGSAIVTFTPDEEYYLSAVLLNGKNVLSKVQEGKLTLETGTYFLKVTFSRRQAYALTVENDDSLGKLEITNPQEKYYEGDEVQFTVSPSEGYAVESVLFNDSKLAEKNGVYTLKITTKNELVVTYEERTETPPVSDESATGEKEEKSEKSGCVSALSALSVVPVLALFPLCKRKKRG